MIQYQHVQLTIVTKTYYSKAHPNTLECIYLDTVASKMAHNCCYGTRGIHSPEREQKPAGATPRD